MSVLPVCSGIRFHVHKPESDGRAGPGGSGNPVPWMKAVMHGDVRRFCSTHEQRKEERILSASWMLRL